jgi:hypothetical protein
MAMQDHVNTAPRVPWNKGKLTGATTQTRLVDPDETPDRWRTRGLAMFNLAIDSKLCGYVVTLRVEDVAAGDYTAEIDFAIAAKRGAICSN